MKMINWGRDGASLSVSDPCDERCLDRGLKPEEGRGLLLLSDCLSSTPSTQAPASYDPRVENKQWTLGSWDWMEGKFSLATERPLKSLAYFFLLFLWPVELWLLTRWQLNSISCSEKCSLAKKGFVPDGGAALPWESEKQKHGGVTNVDCHHPGVGNWWSWTSFSHNV